ncbi:hypothetical protein CesoFtcFv8_020427 [Champsocephalus esox]|uniref:Uncharacterized protein n=1 Tax=Champsocephalus esox TaxID=159716 RepID=A0AAN8BFF7_9TELE|nr:hypothetical protein CesoFtcFv8_020427 [Champsocephalus esox]
MEVQLTAGGANLLMEYEEEEQEVWPLSPERQEEDEEEEEDDDEDLEVFSLMEEEDPRRQDHPHPMDQQQPPPTPRLSGVSRCSAGLQAERSSGPPAAWRCRCRAAASLSSQRISQWILFSPDPPSC